MRRFGERIQMPLSPRLWGNILRTTCWPMRGWAMYE